jgi:hypothetical protein
MACFGEEIDLPGRAPIGYTIEQRGFDMGPSRSAAFLVAGWLVGCSGVSDGKLRGAVYLPANGMTPVGADVCGDISLTFSRPTKRPPDADVVTKLPPGSTYTAADDRCDFVLDWQADDGSDPWNIRAEFTVLPADQRPWDEAFPVTIHGGQETRQDFYLHLPGKTGLPGDYCRNSMDCWRGLSCEAGFCLNPGHKPGGEAERCHADAECAEGRHCVSGRCGLCTAVQSPCDRFAPLDSDRSRANGCCDDATATCDTSKAPPVCVSNAVNPP